MKRPEEVVNTAERCAELMLLKFLPIFEAEFTLALEALTESPPIRVWTESVVKDLDPAIRRAFRAVLVHFAAGQYMERMHAEGRIDLLNMLSKWYEKAKEGVEP